MKPAVRRDLGSFLSDTPPPQKPTRPQYMRVTNTSKVRDVLRARLDRWLSMRELADACALSMADANSAVNSLVQRGEAERSIPPQEGRRLMGQTYRWVRR